MKKLVVVFLCFFASNAFASSADSGKCPWKMPFTISLDATGTLITSDEYVPTHGSDQYTGSDTTCTEYFSFTIDTSLSYWHNLYSNIDSSDNLTFSLQEDTLRYVCSFYNRSLLGTQSTSLTIAFEPGTDSILSFICKSSEFVEGVPPEISGSGGRQGMSLNLNFQIASLIFDDTSIFTQDSSFVGHNISISEQESTNFYEEPDSYEFGEFDHTDFTASSVTLSGIFRPATFSDPSSIVTKTTQPNNLAIYASNGSIVCSFDVANHARNLEIFSPLGIREVSFTIPAGQTEASLPHLPVGFYFVRLDGSMAKIYISGY